MNSRPVNELDPEGTGFWQDYKDWWQRRFGNCPPPKTKTTYTIQRPKKPDLVYETWKSYLRNHKDKKEACEALIKAYELAKKRGDGKTADNLGKVIATFCME